MALAPKVRLFFPGINGRPDAELWTTERLLTTSSSYFGNLFRSGIAETVTIGVKRARTRSSTVEQAAASRRLLYKAPVAKQLVEDSDRETDALTFQGKLGQVPPAPHDPLDDGEIPYKQVTVEQAAYTTYRAVLLYLSTGFIQLAPLSSSFAAAPVPREARTAALFALHIVDPFLPVPASPESVYRLAHVLDLKQLKSMALRFVRDEALTVSTAPAELFSELARDNVEWRTMILDWIMERWDEVEGCEGWTATMQRVEKGEIDGAASLMVEVLRRVAKRKGASSLPLAPRRASSTLLLTPPSTFARRRQVLSSSRASPPYPRAPSSSLPLCACCTVFVLLFATLVSASVHTAEHRRELRVSSRQG